MDGHESVECFNPIYNLKDNPKQIEKFFIDLCAIQTFIETDAEMIVICFPEGPSIILREVFQSEIEKINPIHEEIEIPQI